MICGSQPLAVFVNQVSLEQPCLFVDLFSLLLFMQQWQISIALTEMYDSESLKYLLSGSL